MTRPRMLRALASWISVWIAMPAVDIAKSEHRQRRQRQPTVRSVATAAIAASAVASELPSVTRIKPDECARWPSQTPPRMAPPPIVEAMIARPPAPALEHVGGKSRQQLIERPSADAERDQQHQQRGDARMRRRVADAFLQIGGEASLPRRCGASVGAMRMRASASRKAT